MLDAPGPRQLTVYDALETAPHDHEPDVAAGELERLGESDGFGWTILELLERAGWSVHVTRPFAGQVDVDVDGIMVIASHRRLDWDVRIAGPTVADCAPRLLEECGRYFATIRAADKRQRDADAALRDRDGDAADLAGAPPR